ncbi:hypothetical protein G7Y79_00006g017990 [Physcia stellaris]|nr:hypothetical protein G7Y79_00006g017990 [Physcia stellaris]
MRSRMYYSQNVTTSFAESISVKMSGELFGIGAKATNEYTSTTVGTTSSTAIVCGATGTLAPSQGVQVTGLYQTGKGIFDYTSTVTVFLKDETSFSYTEKGVLTNIAYSICHTSAQSNNDARIVNNPGLQPTKRALANLR